MYNNISITALLLMYCLFSYAQPKKTSESKRFELTGNVFLLKTSKAILYYEAGGKEILDTVSVNKGNFTFKGKVDEPTFALLMSNDGKFRTWLFLENSKMTIKQKDSAAWILTSNSKAELENLKVKQFYKTYNETYNVIYDQYEGMKGVNSLSADSKLRADLSAADSVFLTSIKSFINAHPKSFVSAYELNRISSELDFTTFRTMYDMLDPSIKQSINGKRVANRIESLIQTTVGKSAMDFTQKNPAGEDVKLTDFRGKYVLVDFWASWCGPCRMENPNLVKAYNTYKRKGLEIISISLDYKADKWKEAIEKDQLNWIHVSDLKGWKNDVAILYGITAVPTNFLIDPTGRIVAKNLREETLQNTLSEIFQHNQTQIRAMGQDENGVK